MNDYNAWRGVDVILTLAPIAIAVWSLMLWALFNILGIKPKERLREISMPESVFFAGYAFASAYLIGAVFSKFF